LENNQEKDINDTSIFRGDFADFEEDGEFGAPELDEDIATQDINEKVVEDEIEQQIDEMQKQKEENETKEENQIIEDKQEKEKNNETQYLPSPWDNFKEENSAVKKYLFYISKDFVPFLDGLTTDEKSAYINDAIQKKIDLENIEKQKEIKSKVAIHLTIMILIFIFATPFVLWLSHKAIMMTFDNYKYSQENFEKLYKERFSKDRAYMRSIQYNKEHSKK